MNVEELRVYLAYKTQNNTVALQQPGSPLIIPITAKNIILLENAQTRIGTNLWNDGKGAFSLKERYNYLLKMRRWREIP